jgi:hypothetical protein
VIANPPGMRLRAAALPLLLVVSLVGAGTSSAAVAPQVVDPVGDAVGLQGMHDIASVTYAATSTTKRAGKRVVRTPKELVITLSLAGAPAPVPGTLYGVTAVTDCGLLELTAAMTAPGLAYGGSGSFFECGPPQEVAGVTVTPTYVSPRVTTTATAVVFTVPWSALPKEIGLGDEWFDLGAYTTLADPVIGFSAQTLTTALGVDAVLDQAEGERARLG